MTRQYLVNDPVDISRETRHVFPPGIDGFSDDRSARSVSLVAEEHGDSLKYRTALHFVAKPVSNRLLLDGNNSDVTILTWGK